MTGPLTRNDGGPINLIQLTRHQQLLEQYVEYLPVAQRLQLELLETIDQLREVQSSGIGAGDDGGDKSAARWDDSTVQGLKAWAEDIGVSWRALRRARFRQDKASELLLTTLTARTTQTLHLALPPHFQRYIQTAPMPPIYTILPPKWYSDRAGRPTGVLTLRHVKRDVPSSSGETGKEGIREFAWWIAELTRRVMKEWYEGEFREEGGKGGAAVAGGGCVLVVDAKDAGMKNLELELLPSLISINHNHFPSQFSTVYVLNHSWTHSGLWACMKRVLPQSALEKIVFLKGEQEIADVFDLERLPRAYGGTCDRDLTKDALWMYDTYGAATLSTKQAETQVPATVAIVPAVYAPSYESIADVFYSARNTPIPSAQASPVLRPRRGTANKRPARLNLVMTTNPSPGQGLSFVPLKGTPIPRQPQSETAVGPSTTRVKSISEFQLYLSPSRVANLDLLLGSDEEASDEEALQLESLRARQRARRESRSSLRSSVTSSLLTSQRSQNSLGKSGDDGHTGDIKARRPAITPWITGSGRAADSMRQASWDDARSYSASLTRHHAQGLTRNKRSSRLSTEISPGCQAEEDTGKDSIPAESASSTIHDAEPEHSDDTRSTIAPTTSTRSEENPRRRRVELPISAYDRMMNPMFGYPALQTVSTSGSNLAGMLRPRYGRKRKRDLAKTLLFLFLLRLDAFRRWIGQATTDLVASALASIGLGGWFKAKNDEHHSRRGPRTHGRRDPEQAFAMARHSHAYTSQGLGRTHIGGVAAAKGDWLWMVITIVLVRGSWGRLLLSTLEELRRVKRVFTTGVL